MASRSRPRISATSGRTSRTTGSSARAARKATSSWMVSRRSSRSSTRRPCDIRGPSPTAISCRAWRGLLPCISIVPRITCGSSTRSTTPRSPRTKARRASAAGLRCTTSRTTSTSSTIPTFRRLSRGSTRRGRRRTGSSQPATRIFTGSTRMGCSCRISTAWSLPWPKASSFPQSRGPVNPTFRRATCSSTISRSSRRTRKSTITAPCSGRRASARTLPCSPT